ncbi:hypothetical protein ACFL51_00675 [Myxococcota bacterium]
MQTETSETSRQILKRFRTLVRQQLHEPMRQAEHLDRDGLIAALNELTRASQANGTKMPLAEVGDLLVVLRTHLQLSEK